MKCISSFVLTCMALVAVASESLSGTTRRQLTRKDIITKHNFMFNRQRKSDSKVHPPLPKPFVITTNLEVRDDPSVTPGQRRARTWVDTDGATVIEGIRMPDDESDRVTWRNGRVINNVFVPYENGEKSARASVSISSRVAKQFDDDSVDDQIALETEDLPVESRDYSYHAGSTKEGRPVYYVVDDNESQLLHSDRSPYTYEPADASTSITSQVADHTQKGTSDFVIKEHTYSMCPGCPTFSIPVPIPKDSQQHSSGSSHYPQLQQGSHGQYPAHNLTLLDKMSNSVITAMEKLQNTALSLLDPMIKAKDRVFGGAPGQQPLSANQLTEKHDSNTAGLSYSDASHHPSQKNGNSPLVMAGMAAAAVGGMALLSSAMTLSNVGGAAGATTVGGRSLNTKASEDWAEIARRKFQLFQELSWDSECIFAELCEEAESGLSDADNIMMKVIRHTCQKKSTPRRNEKCAKLRNNYRREHNHRSTSPKTEERR